MSIHTIKMIKNYKANYLKSDLVAGISVAVVSLPQVMAYAMIAGLNPIYGIYTFIVSTIVATLTGVSNYMVVGPTNIITVTIASTLNSMEIVNSGNYLEAVLILTFLAGVIQVILGSLRLGNFINYISHSVISGLTMGVALIIGVGQINELLGLSVSSGSNVFSTLYKISTYIENINYYALFFGILTIIVIFIFGKILSQPSLPYIISVIISVMIVYIFNPGGKLELIGSFSSAVPSFYLFNFDFSLIKSLLGSAFSIAIIGFVQVLSIVKAMEQNTGQEAQLNKEFIGQGITNISCSFFQSFAITGSFTRTFTNYESGARTRLSQLFAGLSVLIFILLFQFIIRLIPISSLAAIVIVIAFKMIDKDEIKRNFKTTWFDAVVFSVTFMATILTPRLDYAVLLGIFMSFILVLRNTSDIDYTYIKYYEKEDDDFVQQDIVDVRRDKYIIINLSGTLHFNSAENLKAKLNKSFQKGKIFVIRVREVDEIDITSINELDKFIDMVYDTGGEVIICGVKKNLYRSLESYGIINKINRENVYCSNNRIFSSTKDAIERAKEKSS